MKKLADDLRRPYQELSLRHKEVRDEAAQSEALGRVEMNQWPRIQSVNKREIQPLFRRWSKDLKKQIRPAKFKRLHRRKRRLLGLLALGWFQPKAFYIRMLNFLMRTVIWTVTIVKLAVVLLLIYGAVKLAIWVGRLFQSGA